MPKKKTEKALKTIEKDVKKALHKGATERGVGLAVDTAIAKDAERKRDADKKDAKPSKSGGGKKTKIGKPASD